MKEHSKSRRSGAARVAGRNAAPEPTERADERQETKGPREAIEQAARDISRGLRDTDLHGTPSNVPGPGPDPEQSPGAEVPPDERDVRAHAKPGKQRRP